MHHINSSYIHGFLAVHLQNSPALATCVLAFHRHPSSPMLKQPPGEHERDGCMNGAVNIQKIKICINMYSLICICIFTYVYLCIYIYFYMYTYIWANYRDLSPGEVHFGSRYDSLVHFQVSQKPGRRFETIWLIGDTRQRLQTTTLCCWLTMRRTALSQIQQMRRALGSARVKALCGHTRTGKEVHKAGIKSSLRSRGWSMSSQCTKQFQRLYLYI